MKKLLIGLATAGLFGSAGILACGLDDKDASVDATPMASKAAPAVTSSKQAMTKTAAKAKAKPAALACEPSSCNAATPSASSAESSVVACEGGGC